MAYRNYWCARMLSYMAKSEFYEGDEMKTILMPHLGEEEVQFVFVTHDESTFYANDGKNDIWLMDGENYLRKKGPGQSIMISEFQCPCHGTMKRNGWSSRKIFKAGGDREGWWTYHDMVKQLEEDAIKLFEVLHPGCKAVFLLDNSSNHNAFADDALVASRMTLNEKPWSLDAKYQFKDTEVVLADGTILKQSFFYYKTIVSRDRKGREKKNEVRYFKGKCSIYV